MREDQVYVWLLEQEISALRSVLAEYDGDKLHFTQMVCANAIEAVLLCLRHP